MKNYHAYLLRCWQEPGAQSDVTAMWRFSLENTRSGERRGFAGLAALVAYLEAALVDSADTPESK
jgi:hypothetical protein